MNGRSTERSYEAARLCPESFVRVGDGLQLGGEQPDVLAAGLLECLHLAADPFQRFLDRSDKVLHRFLPRIEVMLGSELELRELRLRKLDELLVVAPEGLGAHRAQLRRQLFSRLGEHRHLLRSRGPFVVERRLEPSDVGSHSRAPDEPRESGAKSQADE